MVRRWSLDVNCVGNHARFASLRMIFCSFGIIWKNGVILAIIFAAWELGMVFVTIFTGGDSSIRYLSVIGWGMIIVDAGVLVSWPDNWQLVQIGLWGGGQGEENFLGQVDYIALPGADRLQRSLEIQT